MGNSDTYHFWLDAVDVVPKGFITTTKCSKTVWPKKTSHNAKYSGKSSLCNTSFRLYTWGVRITLSPMYSHMSRYKWWIWWWCCLSQSSMQPPLFLGAPVLISGIPVLFSGILVMFYDPTYNLHHSWTLQTYSLAFRSPPLASCHSNTPEYHQNIIPWLIQTFWFNPWGVSMY